MARLRDRLLGLRQRASRDPSACCARANFDASSVAPQGSLSRPVRRPSPAQNCCHPRVSEACAWRPNFMGRFHLRLALTRTGIGHRLPNPVSTESWLTASSAGSPAMDPSSRHEHSKMRTTTSWPEGGLEGSGKVVEAVHAGLPMSGPCKALQKPPAPLRACWASTAWPRPPACLVGFLAAPTT